MTFSSLSFFVMDQIVEFYLGVLNTIAEIVDFFLILEEEIRISLTVENIIELSL